MSIKKINFENKDKQQLAGRLEMPKNGKPHNYVIFAHCFTCSKNLTAIINIARELTSAGYAVLRFDFTGLGESDGDFENTNFSGNIEDLVAAANFLKENYQAPTILIGHSLGGAAAILAAAKLPEIKAVSVINSPSYPAHVLKLIGEHAADIAKNGKARVNLGGRSFTIKKQFLDDLESNSLLTTVSNFKKALLLFHSPQDRTVAIKNAEDVYKAAHHPKSFISLDGVDHMLSKTEDSQYVGKVIASWVSRYVNIPIVENITSKYQVSASLDREDIYTTQLKLGSHLQIADEPATYGGNDFGPSPYEYLSAALASCTAITVQMYAKRKEWELENIKVDIDYDKKHAVDCENCEDQNATLDTFSKRIGFTGNLTEEQRSRLIEISKKCPVHKTLENKIQIITELNS